MITVCAWCQRLVGVEAADRLLISHGICPSCQTATAHEPHTPVLVVPVQYANLVPPLQRLLRETGIPVVLDRRVAQRRRPSEAVPADERRQRDRRAAASLTVC